MFVQYFCIYLMSYYFATYSELLNKEPFWLKLSLNFALPPSPVCLLCSVSSTSTFAVMIACTMPSGITWFFALGEGRKVGRNTSMYMDVSEPPNPFWAVYEDLLIFYIYIYIFSFYFKLID